MAIMNLQGILGKFWPGVKIHTRSMIEVEGYQEYGTGKDKCWVEVTGDLPPFAEVKAKERDFNAWLKTVQENIEHNKAITDKINRFEGDATPGRIREAILDDGDGVKWLRENRDAIKEQRAKLRPV